MNNEEKHKKKFKLTIRRDKQTTSIHTKYNKKAKQRRKKSSSLYTSKCPQHTLAINLLY